MKTKLTLALTQRAALLLLLSTLNPQLSTVFAQVPPIVSYQGRMQAGGTNFSGAGQFKFALVSPGTNVSRQATATAMVNSGFLTSISVVDGGAGYLNAPAVTITDATGSGAAVVAQVSGGAVTNIPVQTTGGGYSPSPSVNIAPPPPTFVYGTFWSNDGSSNSGSEPASSVPVPVQQGLFTVFLGDTNLPDMQALPAGVFAQPDLHLRLWFSDGAGGFVQLAPDQRVGAAGYALMAAQVADGAIDATGLADNAITTDKLATNTVTSERIQDGTIAAADLGLALLDGTFWKLGGNAGVQPANQFLGTTDRQPLELKVEGRRALRLEPATNATFGFSPNVIGGHESNRVAAGIVGATIAGGGRNFVGGHAAAVPGGYSNSALGNFSFAAGLQARANHPGAFAWADTTGGDFASTGSDQFIIRAAGGVGIGTNAPSRTLHVAGDTWIDRTLIVRGGSSFSAGMNVSGGELRAFDSLRLYDSDIWFRSTSDANHGLGWYGTGKLFDGTNVNGPVLFGNNGGALGQVNLGVQNIVLRWTSSRVGIGRHPAANTLEVEGNAYKTASGNWLANSDARIKTGVRPVSGALEKLSQVRLVSFRYTDEYRAQHPGIEEREYLNVIAQEFQKVFPEHVKSSGEKLPGGDEILQVDAHPLTIYSAAAVQELHRLVKQKEAEIRHLEQRLARLEALVSTFTTKSEASSERRASAR